MNDKFRSCPQFSSHDPSKRNSLKHILTLIIRFPDIGSSALKE